MARILPKKFMERRQHLFQLWKLGYVGENGKVSELGMVLFAKFIHVEHSELILSKEERQLVETMSPVLSEALSDAIESRLSEAASQTGVHRDLLLALVYGLTTAAEAKGENKDAGTLLHDASKALLHAGRKPLVYA
jgi:hypothetical protein